MSYDRYSFERSFSNLNCESFLPTMSVGGHFYQSPHANCAAPIVAMHSNSSSPSPNNVTKSPTVFDCSLCQIICTDQNALNSHLDGQKHKKKLVALEKKESGPLTCKVCNMTCVGLDQLRAHENGKGHMKMLKRQRDFNSTDINFSEDGSPKKQVLGNPKMPFVPAGYLDSSSATGGQTPTPSEIILSPSEDGSREAMVRCELCGCKFFENLLKQHLASEGHQNALQKKNASLTTPETEDDLMSVESEKSLFDTESHFGSPVRKMLKFQDQSGRYNRFLPKFSVPVGYSPITEKVFKVSCSTHTLPHEPFRVPQPPSPMKAAAPITKEQEQPAKEPPTTIMETESVPSDPIPSTSTSGEVEKTTSKVVSVSTPSVNQTVPNIVNKDVQQMLVNLSNEQRALSRTVIHTLIPDKTCILTPLDVSILNQLQAIKATPDQVNQWKKNVQHMKRAICSSFSDMMIDLHTMTIVDVKTNAHLISDRMDSLILELRSVGSLGLNVILKEAEDFRFVVVLKYKPSLKLLSMFAEKLKLILQQNIPEENYQVVDEQDRQLVTVFPIKMVRSYEIKLTCPAFDISSAFLSNESLYEPADMLNEFLCLEALQSIKRIDWYEANLKNFESAFNTICLFKYMKKSGQTSWRALNTWTVQVMCFNICLYATSHPNTYELFILVLKNIANNNFKTVNFVCDPTNWMNPLSICNEPNTYNDLIALAGETVKLIEQGQIWKVFGLNKKL